MEFVITFLEGLISFLSPCMLPMLPIYLSYFACGADQKHKVFLRALSFVIGFTTVFTSLGLFAGTLGSILQKVSNVCAYCMRGHCNCVWSVLFTADSASFFQGNAA